MKHIFTTILSLFAFSAIAQQPEPKKKAVPVKELTGTWIMEKKNGVIIGETWIAKDNNHIMGKSYLIKNGDTTILETVDLVKEGDDIFYIPVAYGQNDDKPVRFKLVAVDSTAYVFENPEHDFPKRVVYDFTGSDALHAYVDDRTENKRQHFYYKKKK